MARRQEEGLEVWVHPADLYPLFEYSRWYPDRCSEERVLGLLDRVKGGKTLYYNRVLELLIKRQMIQEVVNLTERMNAIGMPFDIGTFTLLLKICKTTEACEQIEKQIEANNVQPNLIFLTQLINLYVSLGVPGKAVAVYEKMKAKGIKPDAYAISALLKLYSQRKDYHGAVRLMSDAKAEGVVLNEVAWLAFIMLCEKARNLRGGLGALEDMRKQGLQPTMQIYTALLKACSAKGSDPTQFAQVMAQLEKENPPLVKDIQFYTTLINFHSRTGDLKQALAAMYEAMQGGFKPDLYTFTSLLYTCSVACGESKSERTLEFTFDLLWQMRVAGFQPSERTYVDVMRACEYVGKVAKAVELLNSIIQQDNTAPVDNILLSFIRLCAKADSVQEAVEALQRLSDAQQQLGWKLTYHVAKPFFEFVAAKGDKTQQGLARKLLRDNNFTFDM